jgi:Flp pilus assembly protein TadB
VSVSGERRRDESGTDTMGLAIVLLILALIFGVVGFIVEALQWIIVIALILLVVSFVTGGRARRGTRP